MKRYTLLSIIAAASLAAACQAGELNYDQRQNALLTTDFVSVDVAGAVFTETPSRLGASPNDIQLGAMAYGKSTAEMVFLINTSSETATVNALSVTGSDAVRARFMGHDATAGDSAVFDAVSIDPGAAVILEIAVDPATPGAFEAEVRVDGFGQAPAIVHVAGVATLDAVIALPISLEGTRVAMPTYGHVDVHLDGQRSASPHADIASYYWTVDGDAELLPSPRVPSPTLRIYGPGDVVVRLAVTDGLGTPSPFSAPLTIAATDDNDIKVEVTWEGPTGADLDVHLAHRNAKRHEGYDDPQWACWQDNPQPFWPTDAPLTIAAPVPFSGDANHDAVALATAQTGLDYDVAVRYPDTDLRGDAEATFTVTVRGQVLYTATATLSPGQTWDIGAVNPSDVTFQAR